MLLPRTTTPRPADPDAAAEPAEPVSRPLSDPDLTPLMGIPIIRPVAVDAPRGPRRAPEVPPAPEPAVPDAPPVEFPAPSPRVTDTLVPDDDVVFLQPSAPTGTFPVVRPQAASGSPQPVWFRVVRRDGEPVPAAVVALLDDHGREVDTAKTAVDGGGELHSPHAGRFLMIVSADGYQPRAAILTVDDGPVELALLLPRSAVVSGTVRSGGSRSATSGSPSGRTTTPSTRPSRAATAATGSTTWPRAPTPWRRRLRPGAPWRG